MNTTEVHGLIAKLLADSLVYAPAKKGDKVLVSEIKKVSDIDCSGELPENSFKSVFLPVEEKMGEFKNGQLNSSPQKTKKTVAWGMNILDLQAFTLFEKVFEKDVYYQKRRQNTCVIGYTNGIEDEYRKYKVFNQKYAGNVLEHLIFDVFVQKQKNGNFILFSGSEKGQLLLEKHGITDYENIEFVGYITEDGLNPRLLANKEAVELGYDHPVWEELAEICLSCGKCSMVCPTCFCFDQTDKPTLDGVEKKRQWTSCFYPEFSKVAGDHKDLDSVKKRLYFWYYHKFVRIPEELSYYGCVSCMRCFKACPAEINIVKTLQKLSKKEK